MKTRKLLVLGLLPVMFACGGSEEESASEEESGEETTENACIYKYDNASTSLNFTAFKLTDKVGVDGSFMEISATGKESEDMYGVFEGMSFEVPVSSLNTQDETRDYKIKNSFFGNLESSDMLTGTVNSMDASTANVTVNMNGNSVDYDAEIKTEGQDIKMLFTLDILDFDGQIAIDSLGVVCEAKHTGPDGVNKLWSDVNIAAKTTLIKECE